MLRNTLILLILNSRPLTGINCKRELHLDWKCTVKFSSPYGDGTQWITQIHILEEFSPPYGENPLSHGLRRASSPEGGAFAAAVTLY